MINLIAASFEDWHKCLSGSLHDEKLRYSIPEECSRVLVDEAGPPLLLIVPGVMQAPGVEAKFHIYPPRRQKV